jgi:hypothetical protein
MKINDIKSKKDIVNESENHVELEKDLIDAMTPPPVSVNINGIVVFF